LGIRKIETQGRRILLNGEPVVFRGINRHDEYPLLGNVMPEEIYREDLRLMKQAGMNALRTAHYPNDPRIYDLADELGFLVIEEIPATGLFLNEMNDVPEVLDLALDYTRRTPGWRSGSGRIRPDPAKDMGPMGFVGWKSDPSCWAQSGSNFSRSAGTLAWDDTAATPTTWTWPEARTRCGHAAGSPGSSATAWAAAARTARGWGSTTGPWGSSAAGRWMPGPG